MSIFHFRKSLTFSINRTKIIPRYHFPLLIHRFLNGWIFSAQMSIRTSRRVYVFLIRFSSGQSTGCPLSAESVHLTSHDDEWPPPFFCAYPLPFFPSPSLFHPIPVNFHEYESTVSLLRNERFCVIPHSPFSWRWLDLLSKRR